MALPTENLLPALRSADISPAWTVEQFQGYFPHLQIAPLPLHSDIVNLPAALAANPTTQEPLAQPVDVHQHKLVGLFHLGYGVSCQTHCFLIKVSMSTSDRTFRVPWQETRN
jgi:hypothetical protein